MIDVDSHHKNEFVILFILYFHHMVFLRINMYKYVARTKKQMIFLIDLFKYIMPKRKRAQASALKERPKKVLKSKFLNVGLYRK